MTTYIGFAYMYDQLMKDIPYEAWASYIDDTLVRHLGENRQGRIVVDMACGTGIITLALAKLGYDMIGIDISADMLSQAQAKTLGENILYLAQDMRQLDLYGTVDAAICTCDGLNYILDEGELAAIFAKVKMFMNPGGIFIFDMNTEYKFQEVLGGKSFIAKGVEWDNHYDPATKINKYHVVFTPKDEPAFEEVHHQRAYAHDMVCNLLQNAGFATIQTYDSYSHDPISPSSTRYVFIASL